ncbi:hypothetical protein AAG747_10210 [Rapidithrix thailandica]|uniref:Outer membrane protein beta-barrel domain-containing protein n=1 Tax=Rapidithrix thailandica TaxID=413964 RepID=A0AAW9S5E0_9BACT
MINRMKILWICLLLGFVSTASLAQTYDYVKPEEPETEEPEPNVQVQQEKEAEEKVPRTFNESVDLGLDFSFLLSSNFTDIELAPIIGYRPIPLGSVGISPVYRYHYEKYYFGNSSLTTNAYGFRLYTRYDIQIGNFILFPYAEYEQLSYKSSSTQYSSDLNRRWHDSAFVGLGYTQTTSNVWFHFKLLYNTMKTSSNNPIYNSPLVYRFGFIF